MEFQVVSETVAKKIIYTCTSFSKYVKQILIIFLPLKKTLFRTVYRKQYYLFSLHLYLKFKYNTGLCCDEQSETSAEHLQVIFSQS